MSLRPPHARRIRLVTVAVYSSRRSYRPAQNSVAARASVRSSSGSRNRWSSASAYSDPARYTNRLQATAPAPGVASPCSIRLASPIVPACTVAQSCTACSRTGTRVSTSTARPPAHTSTAPCPYCAMPSSTSVSGPATAGLLAGAISRATSDRPCQNTAPASSRLSNRSSSAYTRPPQLASTEW
jgi:hypothetical protein